MKHILFLISISGLILSSCQNNKDSAEQYPLRFFSDDSFWNTPIGEDPELDPRSDYWISLLEEDASEQNFGINLRQYTIPVYEVDSSTPLVKIGQFDDFDGWETSQSNEFREKGIPLPASFLPSPGEDAHLAIIDRDKQMAWDMFYVKQNEDGTWESATGMVYPLDGPGIFELDQFDVKDNETIHKYGPGRAAGVPIIAGLILYDEVVSGKVEHVIAAGSRFVGYKEFVYPPATWTDGNFPNGIPEGSMIQLDPDLDLSLFDLLPGEKAIAIALQKYGASFVDFTRGNCLYGEGLWHKENQSWDGLVRSWNEEGSIRSIPLKHYRFLKVKDPIYKGDTIKEFFQADHREYEARTGKKVW